MPTLDLHDVHLQEIASWAKQTQALFANTARTAYAGVHYAECQHEDVGNTVVFGITDIVIETGEFLAGMRQLVTSWRSIQNRTDFKNKFHALSAQLLQAGSDIYLLWSDSAQTWMVLLADLTTGISYRCDGASFERFQYSPRITLTTTTRYSHRVSYGRPVDSALCTRWIPNATAGRRSDLARLELTYGASDDRFTSTIDHDLSTRVDVADDMTGIIGLAGVVADRCYDDAMDAPRDPRRQSSPSSLSRIYITATRYI